VAQGENAASAYNSDGHIFVVAMALYDTGGAEGGKSGMDEQACSREEAFEAPCSWN
jgi:hypothetical protein